MQLIDFARLHGVHIDSPIEDGRWHRCPTESHPRKKNGAYRSMGTYGHIQDHAAHPEPILWTPEENEVQHIDRDAIARRASEAAARIKADQEQAAKKAAWMLHGCELASHAYLKAKGFPEGTGHVWRDEKAGDLKLCIPMRVDGRLVGLQTISDQPAHERINRHGETEQVPAFEKKFIYGQRTSGATFCINNKGPILWCEGAATGYSVAAAMHALKQRFTLIITFTAGNMLKMAKGSEGFVIADFDRPSQQHPHSGGHGVAVAKEIGLPFWQSDREGEDANDFHQRKGLFQLSQSLKTAFFIRRQA